MINNIDKEGKEMIIIVNDKKNRKDKIIKSREIISPKYKEYLLIDIYNYKMKLIGYSNRNNKSDIKIINLMISKK